MFSPGPWELLKILLNILIIFGAGKLPEIGGAVDKGIGNFRDSTLNRGHTVEKLKTDAEADINKEIE